MVALVAAFAPVATTNAADPPSAKRVKWRDLDAIALSDGRTEAIVVPKLGGRLMHYSLIGGLNWIWNGEEGSEKREPPLLWGGDKTYIGPHSMWRFTQAKGWPPPAADFTPHEAELPIAPTGLLLRTTSPEWHGYGARVIREYSFVDGELVITHKVTKVPGSAALMAAWTVTQTIPDATLFVPLNPKSTSKDNVFWFGFGAARERVGTSFLSLNLLRLQPITGAGFKLGAHPAKPALAAVKGALAFLQKADPQEGQYPEGADGAGLSVEVYHHDLPPPNQYTELELLSPLRRADEGASLVTRWSIHPLQGQDERASVERLLELEP